MKNNIILFDSEERDHLLPLTYTRPVGEIRVGILTIREKWEHWLQGEVSYITQDYLAEKYPLKVERDNIIVNGAVLPSEFLCKLIKDLKMNEALLQNGDLIAARLDTQQFEHLMGDEEIEELNGYELGDDIPLQKINRLWDIFSMNDAALRADFEMITKGRISQFISGTNQVLHEENIFIEEGAVVECAILNASNGPIYIGKDTEIMEGSMVRGPFALCDNALLKMGTKVYGATTIGPHCKVGGEVNNVVMFANSNKAHEGFLGNAVIGEWCNLGADSNNSNLKNNYEEVKLWNYVTENFEPTGLQFCGLIMGDHSKCGINTMFNTGTVVGVSANVFGEGFPRNQIVSFAWGGKSGFVTYKIDKACDTASRVLARKNLTLTAIDRLILLRVFELTSAHRTWEKS